MLLQLLKVTLMITLLHTAVVEMLLRVFSDVKSRANQKMQSAVDQRDCAEYGVVCASPEKSCRTAKDLLMEINPAGTN